MRHIRLYEEFCEGDIDDMLSYIRSVVGDKFKMPHYGFDYVEIILDARMKSGDEAEKLHNDIVPYLLKKFEKAISEIYSEETGWFKIYFNPEGNLDRTSR